MARKIIDGLVYDTDKATTVARENPYMGIVYSLFVTENGSWFLYCNSDNKFTPLSPKQAFEWLCNHAEVEAANHYFPGKLKNA